MCEVNITHFHPFHLRISHLFSEWTNYIKDNTPHLVNINKEELDEEEDA